MPFWVNFFWFTLKTWVWGWTVGGGRLRRVYCPRSVPFKVKLSRLVKVHTSIYYEYSCEIEQISENGTSVVTNESHFGSEDVGDSHLLKLHNNTWKYVYTQQKLFLHRFCISISKPSLKLNICIHWTLTNERHKDKIMICF